MRGLIYFDATTDYTDSTVLAAYERMPGGAPPSLEERESYDGYVRWLRRVQMPDVLWGATQDVMTRDELDIAADGALRPRAVDVMTPMRAIAMLYRRPYATLRMPVLFINAQYRVAPNTFVGDSVLTRALHDWEANDFGLRQRETRARIAKALPGARVITVPSVAHTSLPFVGRDIIVREVVRFVGPTPSASSMRSSLPREPHDNAHSTHSRSAIEPSHVFIASCIWRSCPSRPMLFIVTVLPVCAPSAGGACVESRGAM